MQRKSKTGFALIEVLIAVTIISGSLLVIVALATNSLTFATSNLKSYQANLANDEAVEAVKSIRMESWATNIAPLTIGTTYGISLGTTNWGIVATPQTTSLGFTRTIIFNNAYRDSNDDLAASGTLDDNVRKVNITTTWTEGVESKSQTIDFYIANIF